MSEPLGELTSRITSFTVQSNCCGLRNTSYAIGMQDGSGFGLTGLPGGHDGEFEEGEDTVQQDENGRDSKFEQTITTTCPQGEQIGPPMVGSIVRWKPRHPVQRGRSCRGLVQDRAIVPWRRRTRLEVEGADGPPPRFPAMDQHGDHR